jgi:hypothetical protein
MRMLMSNNRGIRPVRFPENYNDSIFDPTHPDYNIFIPMTFSSYEHLNVVEENEISNINNADAEDEEILVDITSNEENSSLSSSEEDSVVSSGT